MSRLQRKAQLGHISSLPPIPDAGPSSGEKVPDRPPRPGRKSKDLSPLPWSEFFHSQEVVELGCGERFNVYRKGSEGLIVLLLHGGGYTGLTWACFTVDPSTGGTGLMVRVEEKLTSVLECQVLAPDLRGHGLTSTLDDYALDIETITDDVGRVMEALYPGEQPPTVLLGHSMGGALAVHVAKSGRLTNLKGLGVIDVVEGSAMEALNGMKTFLRSRPTSFPTLDAAVAWCLSSGTVRCERSARVSMPSQVKEGEDGAFHWRTDLTKTEDFWTGWFQGLSSAYLSVPCDKLLILAGTDRLDKEMTVAQMQGKFQMLLVNKAGHAVQEDAAEKLADALATFAVRHKLAPSKGPFHPSVPAC